MQCLYLASRPCGFESSFKTSEAAMIRLGFLNVVILYLQYFNLQCMCVVMAVNAERKVLLIYSETMFYEYILFLGYVMSDVTRSRTLGQYNGFKY